MGTETQPAKTNAAVDTAKTINDLMFIIEPPLLSNRPYGRFSLN
jgi:hypothetical protein